MNRQVRDPMQNAASSERFSVVGSAPDGENVRFKSRIGRTTQVQIARKLGATVLAISILFVLVAVVNLVARSVGVNLLREPAIAVESEQIDLGVVQPDSIIPVTVRVLNMGGGELRMSDVKGSCDACIHVVSYSQTAITPVNPGEIRLEIKTGATIGVIRKQAIVTSNDWANRPLLLRFQWAVQGTTAVRP